MLNRDRIASPVWSGRFPNLCLAAATAAALSWSGCEKPPEDVGAKYRATLMPKLEALARLHNAHSGLVALLPDGAVDGLDFSSEQSSNAIVVHHEHLEDLKAEPKIELCLEDSGPFQTAQSVLGLVGGTRTREVSEYEENELQCLGRAKYALVLFVRSTDPLHVDMSFDDEKFTPRSAKGSAVLFDIDKAEALGGFEIMATNSPEIKYWSGSGKKEVAVLKDLIRQIGDAVEAGVAKRFPGAKPPTFVVLP